MTVEAGFIHRLLRGDDARGKVIATWQRRSEEPHEPKLNTYRSGPDEQGFFGLFGGRFVAETLMPLILDLERAYEEAKGDPAFQRELTRSIPTTPAGRARSISPSG